MQIRERRQRLGWSLGDLARRADTSAATLSRYENGWTRFEVATLKKLALALGCDLRIELTPTPPTVARTHSKRAILKQLKRLFWDRKLSEQDMEQYPVWLVERVLEYGQMSDIRALQALYGRPRFLKTVAQASRLSKKTAAFWFAMLKKEGMPCTKKRSRRTAWAY